MATDRGERPHLVDTHAHLTSRQFQSDGDTVIERAVAAGVIRIVTLGTDAADSQQAVLLAQRREGVFAAVAIHPNDLTGVTEHDWGVIAAQAREPKVVAIGETGLDRYRDRVPFPEQQVAFDRHLELARERDLPVVIHCRDCYPDVIAQLERQRRPIRGILHSFTGSADDAQALLGLGLHLSFAGMITFANKGLDALRQVAANVPPDRILVETDSPYLTPHPHRGQRNEPAHVRLTAERLADLRGVTLSEIASLTTLNAQNLFRFVPASSA